MTVIATRTTPEIACPPWCTVTTETHVAQLPEWEGYVIHHSDRGGDGVAWSTVTYVDGTPAPQHEPPHVFVEGASDGMPLEEAERLALSILAAVKEARA